MLLAVCAYAAIRRDSAEEGMRGGTRNRIIKCQAFIQALQTGKFPLPLSQHESEQTPRRLFGHHFVRVFFILFIFGPVVRPGGKGREGGEGRPDGIQVMLGASCIVLLFLIASFVDQEQNNTLRSTAVRL